MKNSNISVIIPTYNRAQDLKITLNSLVPLLNQVLEVIIVDQSKDSRTKELIKKLNNPKIKYIYSKIPSITIARNIGVRHSSKKSEFICFIDDDVNLGKNYFQEILNIFKNSRTKAVGAFDDSPVQENLFLKLISKIFFLRRRTKNDARLISPYGNLYPVNLKSNINSQWLPGVNMCYKREVFNSQFFDEHLLGYTIAEDIDFSYRLFKKYPGSLFITPFAKIKHRGSQIERTPTEKMAYINQVDHFYFFLKNMNQSFFEKFKFYWSLIGIALLRSLNLIIRPNKANYLKWKYFFNSLFYCFANRANIKNGKLREFLSYIT